MWGRHPREPLLEEALPVGIRPGPRSALGQDGGQGPVEEAGGWDWGGWHSLLGPVPFQPAM
jgi:hypothetical protein